MIVTSVHVISLPQRQDRRDRLSALWPVPGLPLTFHDAVTAENATIGCLQSHLAVLAAIEGPALILEDDAVFAPGFTLDLTPPGDWRVLWLGRQKITGGRGAIDQVWERPWRIARTHAYCAADPGDLHARLTALTPRSIDPALSQLPVPQYMLRTATAGQGAGLSDITGGTRKTDEFWNRGQDN